jgi:DNA-binding MarR family transcriptional regulator
VKEAADFRECEACACFAVRRAARAITQHYDRRLRPAGLRATQFTLLVVLARGERVPLHRVAERLGLERTTLTRNLRPLLAQGFVRVDPGEDGRERLIAITPRGTAAVTAALPHWRQAQRSVARHLPRSALDALAAAARAAR